MALIDYHSYTTMYPISLQSLSEKNPAFGVLRSRTKINIPI